MSNEEKHKNVSKGKLYEQLSNIIGFLEEEQNMSLIAHRVNTIEVLDEAKKEILEAWNQRTNINNLGDLCYQARLAEWRLRFDKLLEKWFGAP